MNLVLHQRVWERFYTIARRSPAWIAEGRLESRQSILHVIVSRLEDLASRLRRLKHRSRDFR
jgi:error-prone DNA polymerase